MNNNNKVKEFLSKKRRRKEELKKTDVHYFNYLEAMQFILRQQIEALISKCGVTKNIRNTVFEIFFKYTETCITENVDFENVFLQSRFLYRQTKRKNLLREWKQLKQKEQLEDNNNNNSNSSSSNNSTSASCTSSRVVVLVVVVVAVVIFVLVVVVLVVIVSSSK